jgi:hypothetical protein
MLFELDLRFLDKVSGAMVPDINVLRAIVEYWVFRKSGTPLVVTRGR